MHDQNLKHSGQGIVFEAQRVYKIVDDKKYRWGGKTLDGFDCSGFVAYVFGSLFPHKRTYFQTDVAGFIKSGLFERVETPMPGDLVIFPATGSYVNHIGIVVDQNRWIGSQSSTGVEYVKFNNPFWAKRKHEFRRLKQYSHESLSSYTRRVASFHV
ncbi:MAG TPA: NlpC/P60 family protein [Limnobacter sp.]|nr:NlpC/P60 family protein [Limnobacter sp.]